MPIRFHPSFFCFLLALLPLPLQAVSLDDLFPSVIQETFPLRDYGIKEPNSICQLPDGRVFLITNSGECFLFDGIEWEMIPTQLPDGSVMSIVDSKGQMWIGGQGFFGSVTDNFVYHDLSNQYFSKEIDTALPILALYETGSWIHFANNTTLYHFNRETLECKTTQFEGMFDAYHWLWNGKLHLGTKDKIQIWNEDHFEIKMDWPHKYRAFAGWKHDGKSYYINATHLYVYDQNEQLIDTIKDDLMNMRGAKHLITDHHLLVITQGGIIKMHRDGTCEGYYTPWFHQKITLSETLEQAYFGGSDVWLMTDTAIFRINLDSSIKELGVETGYNITGAWDMEVYKDLLYATSKQGFRRWNASLTDFEFSDDNSPDFESNNIFEADGKLFISTWVELGSFENDTYTYVHSDGSYSIFAPSKLPNTFWVVKDSGLLRMNSELEILDELPIPEAITSFAEFNNEIWITTLDGRLLRNQDFSRAEFKDITHLLSNPEQAEKKNSSSLYPFTPRSPVHFNS